MIGPDTVMTFEKWTTKFKPDREFLHAPIWITLLDLPQYFYEQDVICRIVEPSGTPLTIDKATITKSRPTTAKICIEMDLSRAILSEIDVEIRNAKGDMEVFSQKVEYESIPSYCSHCKIKGHYNSAC